MALRHDYRQCNLFLFSDSITLFKKLIRKKVSYLTCILIKGTFLSTNEHPCTFCCFKRPSTHTQDALENALHNKKYFWSHRLTPDESNSCLSGTTVLYMLLRTWCMFFRSIFYSRLLKKNFAVEIISKKEQGWKSIRKWTDIWRSANSIEDIRKWRAYCDTCNHCLHLQWSPLARVTTTAQILNFQILLGQVLWRKHPVLGIKLNPLSLLFQLARYHHNNTNKQL